MSGSARWKENRVRQEIYQEHLKHTDTSSGEAGLNGGNAQGLSGTPERFLQRKLGNESDKRIANREKRNQLAWMILRVALWAAWAAVFVWVSLRQLGIDR